MAAPIGNQYATKARIWSTAIERAIAKRSKLEGKEILDEAADALVLAALSGDLPALKELGDRLEGKVAQGIQLTGAEGGPLKHEHTTRLPDATKGLLDQVRGQPGDTGAALPVQD